MGHKNSINTTCSDKYYTPSAPTSIHPAIADESVPQIPTAGHLADPAHQNLYPEQVMAQNMPETLRKSCGIRNFILSGEAIFSLPQMGLRC